MNDAVQFFDTTGGGTPPPPPTSDPNFENISLLLHGDGTNGAQNNTFLDGSTNNFTITRVGNTTQGTFSPFSPTGWSGYFQDSVADYLTTPSSAQFNMGTGDWTVEGWFYGNKALNQFNVAWHVGTINATDGMAGSVASNSVGFRSNGTTDISASISIANQWAHIAWVKVASSNTVTIYVNGASVASGTYSNSIATGTFTCGFNNASFRYGGYMSNLRVLKGTAQYTSNFTPPTTPLTAIANTSLLTLQDNRFKDNSTNNFTITRFGDTKIEAFSPFNPTAAYSASAHGGSGYFDGTGDYLTSTGSGYALGAGDYTVEAWIYLNSLSIGAILCTGTSPGSDTWQIHQDNGTVVFYPTGTAFITGSGTKLNTWHHVAATRSGSTVRLFIDGVLQSSTTASTNLTNTNLRVGLNRGGSSYFNGYISNARIVKGTALYTSNFTPPTAPVTAITNTSLLLNFTNAGIIDNASKNVLETVGNAQISTSVKKFGTGSMYFDGTGDILLAREEGSNYIFGTADFCIELWLNVISGSQMVLVDWRNAGGAQGLRPTIYYYNGNFRYFVNGSDVIVGGSYVSGQWLHLAVSRSSGSTRMFVNGTQVGSTYADANNYLSTQDGYLRIGAFVNPGLTLNGYIDDLRITKGVARYTANFTPPTQAFPDL